jgi:peptidylprolyl isomerase
MKRYALLFGALLLIVALLAGCGGSGAAVGDRVTVDYSGALGDGTIFDSSIGKEPLVFVIGDGTVITGFDAAVRGMEVGDIETVVIPTAEAYGEYREDLVVVLDREDLERDLEEELEVGDMVSKKDMTSGKTVYFTVVEISDDKVTLDGNNPLAGYDLIFRLELLALESAGSFDDNSEE